MTTAHPDSIKALADLLPGHPDIVKRLLPRSPEEFNEVLEYMLEEAVDYLERNGNHLQEQDENTITVSLVAYLNSLGIRATQEAHTNGHVDVTVKSCFVPPYYRRLGEAKIYGGPLYHVKGLEQLVQRYATGREGFGFLIEYIQKGKIVELVEKIRAHVDQERPCLQIAESASHRIQWAFTTDHEHHSGENFKVLHLSCNLCRPNL